MKIPVNEVFETIQGEAAFTGTPSVFLRLQGCPVGCGWCDTKHTWFTTQDNEVDQTTMLSKVVDSPTYCSMSVDEIVAMVNQATARHIVLTGGEPCLYDLVELTKKLIDAGKTVQIETSGTHEIKVDPRVWITVSPKINMPGGLKVRLDALKMAHEIKMPVGKQADVDLIKQHIQDHVNCKIWLQPLSQSKKATKVCVEQATANNWNVSVQTHKFIGMR